MWGFIQKLFQDQTREFARLPNSIGLSDLRDHIAEIRGSVVTRYVAEDSAKPGWIDFKYRGYKFSVTNLDSRYRLSVTPKDCPDAILTAVKQHCQLMTDR